MTPPHLTSDRLAVPHGFFGSKGGVSKGVYASLNSGQQSDDDKNAVAENRARIQAALNAKHLISLSQICLLYTSPSPRDLSTSRMPSSA